MMRYNRHLILVERKTHNEVMTKTPYIPSLRKEVFNSIKSKALLETTLYSPVWDKNTLSLLTTKVSSSKTKNVDILKNQKLTTDLILITSFPKELKFKDALKSMIEDIKTQSEMSGDNHELLKRLERVLVTTHSTASLEDLFLKNEILEENVDLKSLLSDSLVVDIKDFDNNPSTISNPSKPKIKIFRKRMRPSFLQDSASFSTKVDLQNPNELNLSYEEYNDNRIQKIADYKQKYNSISETFLTSTQNINDKIREKKQERQKNLSDQKPNSLVVDRFDINFLKKEYVFTKLKYSRCPAHDIVSGGFAALFAGFIGFLISEKFGIELVDSGDFYVALMYALFFGFSGRLLTRLASEKDSSSLPTSLYPNKLFLKECIFFLSNKLVRMFTR